MKGSKSVTLQVADGNSCGIKDVCLNEYVFCRVSDWFVRDRAHFLCSAPNIVPTHAHLHASLSELGAFALLMVHLAYLE